MNILCVSPVPTHPQIHGNRARISKLCAALRTRGFRVHFICLLGEAGNLPSDAAISAMLAEHDYLRLVYRSGSRRLLKKGSYGIDDWWDEALADVIIDLCRDYTFSAVLVNYIFLSKAFFYVPRDCLKILDTHDKFADRATMLLNNNAELGFFWTSEEEERRAVNRADLVIAISKEEGAYFRALGNCPVVTIGHMQKRVVVATAGSGWSITFGFIGSMNAVNVTSIRTFLSAYSLLPTDVRSQARLRICGQCCNRLDDWRGYGGVLIDGEVDSPDDFYRHIDCAIVPMDFGTGQKIKYIEALAYGLPVISTHSASGLAVDPNGDHTLPDSRHVLQRMLDVARRPQLLQKMASESRSEYERYACETSEAFNQLISTIFSL
jgi:glycosyltransferase involved in cell wall biosynthesis